ncbi:hypothetical protein N7540_003842 [Penicillium herquei]|nr:hypothetical protein N7540_003842 [Penicillium herquei]
MSTPAKPDATVSIIAHLPTFILAAAGNRWAAAVGMAQVDTTAPTPTAADILAAQRRLDDLMRQAATGRGIDYDF